MFSTELKVKPPTGERLNRDSWIAFGLATMAKKGIDAVRVELLAKGLGITKGSFYHHFKDRQALRSAMLEEWRKNSTLTVIKRLDKSNIPPQNRLKELLNLPRSSEPSIAGANLELAIRQWGRYDKLASSVIKDVDDHRLKYIKTAYEEIGLSKHRAETMSFLFYSALMGKAILVVDDIDQLITNVESTLFPAE